jgi:triacylglycerol lipase
MYSPPKSSPIFLGAAALFAIVDGYPIATAIFAWIGCIQLLNSRAKKLPMKQLIHWLHAMTFEPLALLSAPILRFLPIPQTVTGKGKPILLVHGYLNHSKVWTLQKRRLEKLGYGPIYTIYLTHPFRSIRSYAEQVKAKAEWIAEQTGRKDLTLIGHSMGGLVSLLYATKLAAPNTVTDLITIASPLKGTPMARIGFGANAREMEPNSPLTQELQEAMRQNKQIRIHHIATKTDQIVIPGATAAMTENQHLVLDDIGHASLLYSSRVTDQINQWIKK